MGCICDSKPSKNFENHNLQSQNMDIALQNNTTDYNNGKTNESNKIQYESAFDIITPEENKEIGFDLSLVKRNKLYVNLIYYDLNIISPENFNYYNKLKVDVVGGFHAMDNIDMFKKYLEVIKDKNIPFIVMSSGSSGKDVIPICQQYSFIKEVIIFCGNLKYNEHYLKDYPGYVKKVSTKIDDIYNYIKSFGPDEYQRGIKIFRQSDKFIFSYDEIKLDIQFELCPFISALEYDCYYFLVHRTYAHFFGNINDISENVTFGEENFNKMKDCINQSNFFSSEDKNKLIQKFNSFVNKQNFVELSIREYTKETCFPYLCNRAMRNFEPGLISLAYYMGPLLYGLNKYVKEHPQKFSFCKDMTLYRIIKCTVYDFYLYKMNLNHIICFPSFISTSSRRINFAPCAKAKNNNNKGFNTIDMIKLIMIFNYKHEEGNISPGIIIEDNKGVDGTSKLSYFPKEKEVILFPFTFVRITNIEPMEKKTYEITFDIINRKEYIEYRLKNNVQNRVFFNDLDKIK